MKDSLASRLPGSFVVISAALGLGLLFPRSVVAPPGAGPKRPATRKRVAVKPGPKPARAGHVRPRHAGPKPGPKHLPARVGPKRPGRRADQRVRYVRRHYYWHPRYAPRHTTLVWRDLGYRYYVGGTGYVVLPAPAVTGEQSGDVDVASSSVTSAGYGVSDDRYVQLQELVDLVHEWRTMNESPEIHDRLPSSDAPEETRAIVDQIRQENQLFDEAARSAMRELVAGRSAASQLDSARSHWNRLIELVESLPA